MAILFGNHGNVNTMWKVVADFSPLTSARVDGGSVALLSREWLDGTPCPSWKNRSNM